MKKINGTSLLLIAAGLITLFLTPKQQKKDIEEEVRRQLEERDKKEQ